MRTRATASFFLLSLIGLSFQAAGELAPSGRNLAAPPETAQLDFFVGSWEIRRQGGGRESPPVGRMEAYYILDGFMLQADFRGLDPAGEVTFRGTSLRSFDPHRKKFSIRWAVANSSEYTNILAEMVDGELISTGEGRDFRGAAFHERYRFFDIQKDHFRFQMERTFDGGETWFQMSDVRYDRVAADP